MKKLDELRLNEQRVLVQKWIDNKAKGTIVAPTGFGKSYIGILTIQSMNERHPERTTLIVVPTIVLQNQWKSHIVSNNLLNVDVIVVNTAVKENRVYNLLILDEIHRYGADTFREIFSMVKYNYVLGLTATFARDDKKHYFVQRHCPVIAMVKLSHAKNRKYVSNYHVYCLGIPLTSEQQRSYDDITGSLNFYFAYFFNNLGLVRDCINDEMTCMDHATKVQLTPQKCKNYAFQVYAYMGKRKSFLYNLPQKIGFAKEIIERLNMKTVTFSETVDFAEALSKYIKGSKFIHGSMTDSKRKAVLEEFADNRIKVLNAAKVLDEGVDIPEIELAVICSGSSSQRQSIQRIGRAIRFVEGKTAIIVNLYCEFTQEEVWLRKRLEGIENVKYIHSVNEIKINQLELA